MQNRTIKESNIKIDSCLNCPYVRPTLTGYAKCGETDTHAGEKFLPAQFCFPLFCRLPDHDGPRMSTDAYIVIIASMENRLFLKDNSRLTQLYHLHSQKSVVELSLADGLN